MSAKNQEQNNEQKNPLMKQDIVGVTADRINKLIDGGMLHLPEDYSPENALMAAWLKLQSTNDKSGRPALAVCTKDSVANSLLDMIVQGLTPAKDQCYFVVYGTKLVCLRSYFGDEALLKRVYPEARVYAEPIYKGDVLEYEIHRGRKRITKHVQKFQSVGDLATIVGAYAVVEPGTNHEEHCEIMTIEQIKKAWARGENWPPKQGKMSAHTDHPEEFVKKTVIARACKRLINSSNDSYLVKAVERQNHLSAEAEMQARIEEDANQEVIDLPPDDEKNHILAKDEYEELENVLNQKPEEEESPSSPTARFNDFIDENHLNATKARKVAATMRKLNDVRNLKNEDYEEILNNAGVFLASYRQQHGGQEAFGGPGF